MSNYEIIRRARAEIQARRERADAEHDARCRRLRELSPQIAELDKKLSGTGFLVFKTAVSGGDIAAVRAQNSALQEKRRQLIEELGYPAEYGDIQYTCDKCRDTGYVDEGMRNCVCFRELVIKGRIEESAMGRLLDRQSFDNFDLGRYSYDEEVKGRMSTNLALARQFVKDFGTKYENLLLLGGTGTGKTHISSAIARELIHEGHEVIYDSTQNVISDFEAERFKSGYNSQEESKTDKYMTCRLLILDDLGTEFINQFTLSVMYNLLNTRQNRGLPTVISTNLSAEELARKYEDRIYSRIIGESTILYFGGKDLRLGY